MRHINKQIISGFVNREIKIIKGSGNGYNDGVLLFLDCKTSRNSDKYDHKSVIFWGDLAKRLLEFKDIIKTKQITVIGKSIRNSVNKKCEDCGKEYIQTYDQIRATDFCIGSVDLWKNPHAGEFYKHKEENIDTDNILDDILGE